MSSSGSNPYAPPAADLGSGPRSRGNAARYILGVGFLLLALRDSVRLLAITQVPEGVTIGFDAWALAITVVLLIARVAVALAFFLRWRFAWLLGMALAGYSIGSMIAAMWHRGVLAIVTAILPLLIILIPHFVASVRDTFDIDRRKLMIGAGVLAAFTLLRALLRNLPY